MSAQEQTIRQYQELMQLNAVSHVLRAGRELGILDRLASGQRTAEQLCQELSLAPAPAQLLLETLVSTGLLEKYGEDYALSAAAQLLCQYDRDLGDARWQRLVGEVRGENPAAERQEEHFAGIAATQWIHTSAAMQAAEILDIGADGSDGEFWILDLGCGSGVWSCAMAYRGSEVRVRAVDTAGPLQAACRTAQSIGLEDRFEPWEGDPEEAELPEGAFDLVLVPQRLHALDQAAGDRFLQRAVRSVRSGGRVAVIDLFQNPGRPPLAERLAALRMQLETPGGRIPTLQETQQRLQGAGLAAVQFSFLAASREGLGIAVGQKP